MNTENASLGGLGRTTTDTLLIIFALVVPVISWLYAQYAGESHWFARSGSIMVVIGIVLEGRLFIARQIIYEFSRASESPETTPKQLVIRKLATWVAHFILIVGTIIWGYGDIIYLEFIERIYYSM